MQHDLDDQQPGQPPLDLQRAVAYFSRLRNERLIGVPQSEQCEIAIVVPASGERPQSVIALLESLLAQRGVTPGQFEVIIVVNNAPHDGTAAFSERFANNQALLTLPIWANRPGGELSSLSPDERVRTEYIRERYRFFVIDKSTRGSEMESANVGKARNRGVAEACDRFFERGKNGILFQTDADTRLPNPHFLKRMTAVFADPETIGGSGGGYYEFDINTDDPLERRRLETDRRDLVMLKLIKRMYQYDRHRQTGSGFPGFNMMSRSFETAVIGGLEDRVSGEDSRFGRALADFGRQKGKRLFSDRGLRVVTALRESDRTAVLYKTFAVGVSGGQKLIEDPLGTKPREFVAAHPELQKVGYEAARQAYAATHRPIPLEDAYARLRAKVAGTEHGRAFLAEMDQRSFDSFPWLEEKNSE